MNHDKTYSPLRVVDSTKPYSNDKIKTTLRLDRATWDTFKDATHARGQSSCSVLESLMEAWILGSSQPQGRGAPITINMTFNYNVARPRREPRVEIKGGLDLGTLRKMLAACHRLVISDNLPGYVGFCPYVRRHLRAGGCEGCPHQGDY